MAMIVVVLLFTISTAYSDISYDSIFHGNISQSDRRELRYICGRHYLSNTFTPINGRLLGGAPTHLVEYPWALLLTDAYWTKFCTAVLISRRHVLTAAHCVTIKTKTDKKTKCPHKTMKSGLINIYPRTKVNDARSFDIRRTSSYRAVKVTVHPNYDPCTLDADIALLEISPNMYTDGSPICMPRTKEKIPPNLTSVGFGINPRLYGRHPLQKVDLVFRNVDKETIVTNTPGKSVCDGDSGGPLFTWNGKEYVLLGITSANHDCKPTSEKKKSWFESVIPKLGWICKHSGVCPITMVEHIDYIG